MNPMVLDAGALLGSAVTNLEGQATVIIGAALGLGVSIFAVKRGWRWVRSFSS